MTPETKQKLDEIERLLAAALDFRTKEKVVEAKFTLDGFKAYESLRDNASWLIAEIRRLDEAEHEDALKSDAFKLSAELTSRENEIEYLKAKLEAAEKEIEKLQGVSLELARERAEWKAKAEIAEKKADRAKKERDAMWENCQ